MIASALVGTTWVLPFFLGSPPTVLILAGTSVLSALLSYRPAHPVHMIDTSLAIVHMLWYANVLLAIGCPLLELLYLVAAVVLLWRARRLRFVWRLFGAAGLSALYARACSGGRHVASGIVCHQPTNETRIIAGVLWTVLVHASV